MEKDSLLILKAKEINEILKGKEKEIINVIRDSYILHEQKKTVLPFSSFLRFPNDNLNRIISLPAFIGGNHPIAGLKWISSFPKNTTKNKERASAGIFLNDLKDGRIKCFLEGSLISAKRTAASAALAAKTLHQNNKEEKIGLIGCGRINFEILSFMNVCFHNIKELFIFDLSKENLDRFIDKIRPFNLKINICNCVNDVFLNTNLISFATTASLPFFKETKLVGKGKTILDISLRDLDKKIIQKSLNVVDDFDHVCRENTSIHLAFCSKNNDIIRYMTLGSVLINNFDFKKINSSIIFSPFGLGILDISLSNFVYNAAIKGKIGNTINDFYKY